MHLHVLAETNWVVDFVAPILSRSPGAAELHARAQAQEVTLHVPSISLVEARKVVRERSPREDVNNLRAFVRMNREGGDMDHAAADSVFTALSRYEQYLKAEKREAPARIARLTSDPAVHVFPLDEEMLERTTTIAASSGLELGSFDLAILASVLVQCERLKTQHEEVAFCTLDSDLQPWDRNGNWKPELRDLYHRAGAWVFGDFLLETPPRPTDGG